MAAKVVIACLGMIALFDLCNAGGHGGGHKKVIIHVPFKVKTIHHTHTIVKHVGGHGGGGGGDGEFYKVIGYSGGIDDGEVVTHGHGGGGGHGGHGWAGGFGGGFGGGHSAEEAHSSSLESIGGGHGYDVGGHEGGSSGGGHGFAVSEEHGGSSSGGADYSHAALSSEGGHDYGLGAGDAGGYEAGIEGHGGLEGHAAISSEVAHGGGDANGYESYGGGSDGGHHGYD